VALIGVINDHFVAEYRRCNGIPYDVQAALGKYHCDLSPESPKTRSSPKLMRQREVSFNGRTYRCEWHAKLEPNRNRIHFAMMDDQFAEMVLIGIFVEHLDT